MTVVGCTARLACLALATLAAAGCRSAVPERATGASDAFILDATVLTGERASEQLRVEERQGRFVLMPDGALLAEISPEMGFDVRPGRARVLNESQVGELRSLLDQLGFLDISTANGRGNPGAVAAAPDEVVHILWLSDQGKEWWFVRRFNADGIPDAASTRVLRTLAALGWMADRPADAFLPRRFDFGPDPYARYRTQPAATAKP